MRTAERDIQRAASVNAASRSARRDAASVSFFGGATAAHGLLFSFGCMVAPLPVRSNSVLTRCSGAVVIAALTLAPPALADDDAPNGGAQPMASAPPSTPSHTPATTEHRWYGWQILLIDAGSIALGSALAYTAIDKSSPGIGVASGAVLVGGYGFGGPVVHWRHGNLGRGLTSLGLRLLVPIATGLMVMPRVGTTDQTVCAGAEPCRSSHGMSPATGLTLGLLIGGVLVSGLDAGLLAHDTVPSSSSGRSAARRPAFHWAPTAGYDAPTRTASVGVRGSF